jgi:hypothetical protein
MRALNSLFARLSAREVCDYVDVAVRLRPDLADRIVVAVNRISRLDFKQPVGKQISCEEVDCIIRAAIGANPSAATEIVNAAISAAPLLRDCVVAAANLAQPCHAANAFVEPRVITPLTPPIPPVVSPEQPPSSGF